MDTQAPTAASLKARYDELAEQTAALHRDLPKIEQEMRERMKEAMLAERRKLDRLKAEKREAYLAWQAAEVRERREAEAKRRREAEAFEAERRRREAERRDADEREKARERERLKAQAEVALEGGGDDAGSGGVEYEAPDEGSAFGDNGALPKRAKKSK